MSEIVFWVWNGWGLLYTSVVTLYFGLHIYVSAVNRMPALKKPLVILLPFGVIMTFITSGWVAGVLSLPIGGILAVVIMRFFFPPK